MLDLNNLGSGRVKGSISTQFATTLAVERVLIASGQKVSGYTSFLATLEFVGYIVMILTSLFIISAITIIYTILFLVRVYKYLRFYRYRKHLAELEMAEDIEAAKNKHRFDLTQEEEDEVKNFY